MKRYGIITRKGKRFYRDYKRELKNGKGLSIMDVMVSWVKSIIDDSLGECITMGKGPYTHTFKIGELRKNIYCPKIIITMD